MRKSCFIFILAAFLCSIAKTKAATPDLFVTQDTTWSGAIVLDKNVTVLTGKKLTILPGTDIKLNRGISVTADSNAVIRILGSDINPVSLSPTEPGTYWHNFHASQPGSVLEMTYVDVEGGQIKISNGGTGNIQDCKLHDYNLGDNPILFVKDGNSVYVNRTQVSEYYEINIVRTLAVVENSLLEFPTADAIDFDNAPDGTVIRYTTVRNGRGFNIDGIDFGKVDFTPPGSRARVENCLIYNFSDNGISIGEGALGIVVTGTLIYRAGSGIAVKDSSLATIYNNTFYDCNYGIEVYEKNAGLGAGHAIGYNNIFWANETSSFSLTTDATLQLSYSNLQENIVDTIANNYSYDPFFTDVSHDNYQLSPISPLLGKGINGEDLGAIFPVGGIPVPDTDLRLGHPEANMKFKGDSTINIYWSAGSLIQSVDIEFSKDGGDNWTQLASNINARDESFTWTIPNIYSTKSFIRITEHNDTAHKSANILPFSIVPVGDTTQLPYFSKRAGFYDSPIDVSIISPPGSIVYYTLDGSDPTDRSMVYSGPIHFDEDSVPSGQPELNITASDFPHQPYSYIRSAPITLNGPMHNFYRIPNQTLIKAGVLRSRVYTPGQGLGNVVTATYFIDPNIEETFNVPVISLVTDPENLFNYYTGIYIPGATFNGNAFTGNYELSGLKSERPASFEFFRKNGQQELSLEVGIRTRGEWIRNLGQKALTVFARSEYDTENSFNYSFFNGLKKPGTQKTLDNFKRIILRNNGNEWGIPGNTMCRDACIQSLFDHLDLKYQAYSPSVAFVNGEYWGIHNIRELNDAWGIQKNYGIHRDSIILMEDNLDGPAKLITGRDGEDAEYIALKNFIQQNDMSVGSNYQYVTEHLDIGNFIDYWSATIFSNKKNTDHNQSYWKMRNGQPSASTKEGYDGRWRFMASDFDGAFYEPDFDNLDFMITHMADSLLKRLLINPDFKNKFITRFADLLNSSFDTQRILNRIDEIAEVIEPEMPRHIGRWRTPDNMQMWYDNIEALREFARARVDFQRYQISTQFSLTNTHKLNVSVDDLSHGNINVNTLLINSSLPGVKEEIYPWTGIYYENVPVVVTAVPKAGYRFVRWKENGSTQQTISFNLNAETTLTAIFELDFSNVSGKLVIYPNPAIDGKVYLDDYHRISVYDITGKEVMGEQTAKEMNVSTLEDGMYIVRDETGQEAKLVITNNEK